MRSTECTINVHLYQPETEFFTLSSDEISSKWAVVFDREGVLTILNKRH